MNGKNYGFEVVNLNMNYETPIIWRDDWLKNVGINKIPTTLDETEKALYAIVKGDPTKTGKKVYGISDLGMRAIFGAFGGIPMSGRTANDTAGMWEVQGDKLAYSAVQPYMKTALTLLAKWYKDGIIDPEFILGENTKGYWGESQPFENSKIAMTNVGVWYHVARPVMKKGENLEPTDYSAVEPPFLKVNPNGHYEIAKAPVGPTGKQGTLHSNPVDGTGTFFSKKAVDADPGKLGKMLQLCDYFVKDYDTFVKFQFGEEGKSFKIDPNLKIPTPIDTDKKYTDINVLYPLIAINFSLGFNYDVTLKAGGPDLKWAADTFSYTKNYANPKIFTTASESKYWGDLWKLQQKAYVSIITGDKPIAYFDDFVKQWNSQGGDTIVKEANDIWATMK
jgi:putative aldouronate transport system substrate-binding protein